MAADGESRPSRIRSLRSFSASTFFFISFSPITCHGGPGLFVPPKNESLGFGEVNEVDDSVNDSDFMDLFPSAAVSRLLVLRCFPVGRSGFFDFFFFAACSMRAFFPWIPPRAMANADLDGSRATEEDANGGSRYNMNSGVAPIGFKRTLTVSAHVVLARHNVDKKVND